MEADKKSGFVTLIGRPNVGKSTLMNRLIRSQLLYSVELRGHCLLFFRFNGCKDTDFF